MRMLHLAGYFTLQFTYYRPFTLQQPRKEVVSSIEYSFPVSLLR